MSNLSKYLSGEIDVVKTEVILSREKIPNSDGEYIHITPVGIEEAYCLWNPKEKKKGKTTGGKKPYIMLMEKELLELRKQGKINHEEMGIMFDLSLNSDWGTGQIINKRSKKALDVNKISEVLGYKKSKTYSILNKLKEKQLISVTDDGYFLCRTFIKKGGANI